MSPSASPLSPKFLLDENVNKRLEKFLKSEGYNVTIAPEGFVNGRLADLSKSEKRVLVTNDADFTDPIIFSKGNIFSVVWLRIPQNKPESLLLSFSKLLEKKSKSTDFEGQSVTLNENEFKLSPILNTRFIKSSGKK